MNLKLNKPIHELYLESLTSTVLNEDARRLLGAIVVTKMIQDKWPEEIVDEAKKVYREYYPGMFTDNTEGEARGARQGEDHE